MRKILTIARNDLRIYLSQRSNLVGLILSPLLITVVLGYSFSSDNTPTQLRVDVLDQDQSVLSTQFLADLRGADGTIVLCPIDNNADDFCQLEGATLDQALGVERARDEVTAGFLIIPQGFGAAASSAQALQLDYYSTADPNLPGPVAQAVQSVLQRVNSAAVAASVGATFLNSLQPLFTLVGISKPATDLETLVFTKAENRLQSRPAAIRYHTTDTTTASINRGIQSGFGQSVPGMGAMYVMFTVLGGTAVLLRERRQWTLQRLAAMPITRAQILGGKILSYFSLGMIQFMIIFAVGLAVGLDFGDDLLGLLAIMIAFVLCMTAAAFVLAIYMQNEEQAAGIARLLGLTLAPLGGAWWPLEIVPGFMQTIGQISPIAWAMQGFRALMFNQGTLVTVLPQVGILLAVAVLLFVVGIRGFRVSEG